jgi:succinoglycan biosynthesis protein ExoM
MLLRCLRALNGQETEGLFTFSIIIVDNDRLQSAREHVTRFSKESTVPVSYHVEPERGVARARNLAVSVTRGDFIAFLDDDELPVRNWLLTLMTAFKANRADGILGPVKPHYDEMPPDWVIKGGFYDRPSYPTGTVIQWRQGRTGNVLFDARVFEDQKQPFNPAFVTGEDQDFFRRMIFERGYTFVWCHEALAYEVVFPLRWRRGFMIRRALMRGRASLNHPSARVRQVFQSAIAIPIYALALPILLLAGQSYFMKYLVKLCDHAGRLLGLVRLNPVGQTYVIE